MDAPPFPDHKVIGKWRKTKTTFFVFREAAKSG
jgi:hypothetical protein